MWSEDSYHELANVPLAIHEYIEQCFSKKKKTLKGKTTDGTVIAMTLKSYLIDGWKEKNTTWPI